MQKTINSWVLYLAKEKGFSPETVIKYSGNLHIMFRRMRITETDQLADVVINKRLLDTFWRDAASGTILSDSTRAGYLSALKSFLRFCAMLGHTKIDYSEKIQMPKRHLLYLEGLTHDEQRKLRDWIPAHLKTERDLRNAALVMFLWATACRISEALRVRVHPESYIYLHDDRVVSGDFHSDDGKVYVHIMGKGKKDRKLNVNPDAVAYINLYLRERKHRNDILFQNMTNSRSEKQILDRSGAGRALAEVLQKAGVRKEKGLNTHVFRHTAINTWIDMGYSDMQIISMSGHTSPSGLLPYHQRNKYQTDVFGGKGKSTGKVADPALRKLEELIKKRHGPE